MSISGDRETSHCNAFGFKSLTHGLGHRHSGGAVAVQANCVDAGWKTGAVFGQNGAGFYHGSNPWPGNDWVVQDSAGFGAVNQSAIGIIGTIGKDLANPSAADLFGGTLLGCACEHHKGDIWIDTEHSFIKGAGHGLIF